MNHKMQKEIAFWKEKRRAVIFAHYYQRPEIQEIADLVGDSLELARAAAKTEAEVIVLCGVHFMAESAALLAPGKRVLLPEAGAGCPMADMVTEKALAEWKEKNPQAVVVAYVNTSAAVKALSDICCTSANAVKVAASLPAEQEILFLPDRNLGGYVMRQTGRRMELWPGWCNTHESVTQEDVLAAKKAHPDALVLVHPECCAAVANLADHIASTAGMVRFAAASAATEFIVVTESGILERFSKTCPEKSFYLATPKLVCPNMKLTRLPSVLRALETMSPVIRVSEDLRAPALTSLTRMLELG